MHDLQARRVLGSGLQHVDGDMDEIPAAGPVKHAGGKNIEMVIAVPSCVASVPSIPGFLHLNSDWRVLSLVGREAPDVLALHDHVALADLQDEVWLVVRV